MYEFQLFKKKKIILYFPLGEKKGRLYLSE